MFNSNYLIQHSALSIKLNGNSYVTDSTASEYVAVSCVSGTKIALNNVIPLRGSAGNINIDYTNELTYRQWTLSGYNTKFDESYKEKRMYVYARLDATTNGSAGLIVFSPNNYDYNGDIITEASAEEMALYDEAVTGNASASTYLKFTITNDDDTTTTYHLFKSADGTYYKTTKNSGSYYYMQLGVISAPSDNAREWETNLSNFEGLDLGQLGTPMGNKSDTLFEKYGDTIQPLFPFREIDLEGNFIWRNTTLYGPFGKNMDIVSRLKDGHEYIPTLSAIDKNFLKRYSDDDNQSHHLQLGQLTVAGRKVVKETEYYSASELQTAIDGKSYVRSTLKVITEADITDVDGTTYLSSSLNDEGQPTDSSIVASVGDYMPYTETRQYSSDDIVSINGISYLKNSLAVYATDINGSDVFYEPTADSIQAVEDESYTFSSLLADTNTIKSNPIIYKASKDGNPLSNDIATFDHLVKDASGAGVWRDDSGFIHMETDFLSVHNKLTAKEIEIQELNYVGGSIILSPADGFRIERVVPLVKADSQWQEAQDGVTPLAYKLLWKSADEDGLSIKNTWKIGDQATAQTFNIDGKQSTKSGFIHGENIASTFWWRLVLDKGSCTESESIGDVATDSNVTTVSTTYNYIIVSNDTTATKLYDGISLPSEVASGSDIPSEGETVVMVGHQGDDASRQNMIVLQSATTQPYIREYSGINKLVPVDDDNLQVNIQPGNNIFRGSVTVTNWDINDNQWPDSIKNLMLQYEQLLQNWQRTNGSGLNYIRNSAFDGDMLSTQIEMDKVFSENTETYSEAFKRWSVDNAEVIYVDEWECKAASLNNGTITQALTMKPLGGTAFSFSLYGYGGTVTVKIGDEITFDLSLPSIPTSTPVLQENFIPSATCTTLTISGTGIITRLMLNPGNKAMPWAPSMYDNGDAVAFYSNLHYIMEALENGQTQIDGGLILTDLVEVGHWSEDKQSFTPEAGMNGLVNYKGQSLDNDETPAFWAGGEFGDAVATIHDYNILYPKTADTPSSHVPFVVSHSGRGVFNDVIVRGTVFATDGEFTGKIQANSGYFKNGTISDLLMTGPLHFETTHSYQFIPVNDDGQCSLAFKYTDEHKNTYTAVDMGYYKTAAEGAHHGGNTPFLCVGDENKDAGRTLVEPQNINVSQLSGSGAGAAASISPANIMVASPNGQSYISISVDNSTAHITLATAQRRLVLSINETGAIGIDGYAADSTTPDQTNKWN